MNKYINVQNRDTCNTHLATQNYSFDFKTKYSISLLGASYHSKPTSTELTICGLQKSESE